jgi:hypothetical protein
MEVEKLLEFSVSANEARIFIDAHEDGVWLSMQVRGGSAYATMSKEKAREMVAALMLVIEAD